MYKSIAIIGLGSLGGFFVESIAKSEGLHSLILIDPDLVEEKNIRRSVYRKKDIGKFKVDALKDIIEDRIDNLSIKVFPIGYIEGKIYMPEVDLVIDCRDEIISRRGEIDIRLYISYKTLVMDCQKLRNFAHPHTGKYAKLLSMSDLSFAATKAARYIQSKELKECIKNQSIYQFSINSCAIEVSSEIELYNNRPDMIVEPFLGDEKIRNLHVNLPKIIEVNKTKDLTVVVGQEDCIGENIQKIKKNEINEYSSAVKVLSDLVQNIIPASEFYTMLVNDINPDNVYIELLPETGAA